MLRLINIHNPVFFLTVALVLSVSLSAGSMAQDTVNTDNPTISELITEADSTSTTDNAEQDESAFLQEIAGELLDDTEQMEPQEDIVPANIMTHSNSHVYQTDEVLPGIIGMFGLPFLVCILLGTILGYMGTHVLRREIIFIDIALAQFAAVGATIAHFAVEYHAQHHGHFLGYLAAWTEKLVHLFSPEAGHNHELIERILSYGCSFICVMLIALFYAFAKKKITQISLEAIIGLDPQACQPQQPVQLTFPCLVA